MVLSDEKCMAIGAVALAVSETCGQCFLFFWFYVFHVEIYPVMAM